MLWAHAVVDAIEPILHVVEDEVDDRHELSAHLGVAAFGNGMVIIAACPQAAIAAPIVGDVLLVSTAIHDGMDRLTGRDGAFYFIEEAGECLISAALHILPQTVPSSTLRAANSLGS